MTTTVTEISERVEVTGASPPTVVTVTGPGASIEVSPGTSNSVTATSSDGNSVTLEATSGDGPSTIVESPSQVIIESTSVAPGPPGEPGPAGPGDEVTFIRQAATVLFGHRIVRPLSDGTVIYADSTVIGDATKPLWLTLNAASSPGDDVNLVAIGNIVESSWNWTPGLPIFLGPSGTLTQTPPSSEAGDAFMVQLASPDTATDLYYNPRLVMAL